MAEWTLERIVALLHSKDLQDIDVVGMMPMVADDQPTAKVLLGRIGRLQYAQQQLNEALVDAQKEIENAHPSHLSSPRL